MKIHIIGSIEPPPQPPLDATDLVANQKYTKVLGEYTAKKAQFSAACKALGEAAADHNHTLKVGVFRWDDLRTGRAVAGHIIEGASKSLPQKPNTVKHKIIFYRPRDLEPVDTTKEITDTLHEYQELPNIDLSYCYLGKGALSASIIPDVDDAAAVVLIDGHDGTAMIGYAALLMKIPIVTITSFGGSAQSIFDDVVYEDYERCIKQNDKITENDLQALGVTWSDQKDDKDNLKNAQNIISFAEKLVNAITLSNKHAMRILGLTVGYLIAFLLLWVALFLKRIDLATDINFFFLLFIASILGTGLRTLASYQQNKIAKLTYIGIGIDLTIALVLAFGLSLIYLIGGISFTGEMVDLSSIKDKTFASNAVSMSLLGLAAGYIVPLNQLQERLEKSLSENESH
jgi:hypothetical protein